MEIIVIILSSLKLILAQSRSKAMEKQVLPKREEEFFSLCFTVYCLEAHYIPRYNCFKTKRNVKKQLHKFKKTYGLPNYLTYRLLRHFAKTWIEEDAGLRTIANDCREALKMIEKDKLLKNMKKLKLEKTEKI